MANSLIPIVNHIRTGLKKNSEKDNPVFAAIIGSHSLNCAGPGSDIDILVILNENTAELDNIFSKYDAFNKIIESLRDIEEVKPFTILPIPAFALQDHSVAIAERILNREVLVLHLLIYPSISFLERWEYPLMAQGYYSSISKDMILCGDMGIWSSASVENSSSAHYEQIYAYYLNIFLNGYIHYTYMRKINVVFALKYGFHHLTYCVRYLALLKIGLSKATWIEIKNHANELGNYAGLVLEVCQLSDRKFICLPKRLDRLYKQTCDFFCYCRPTSAINKK